MNAETYGHAPGCAGRPDTGRPCRCATDHECTRQGLHSLWAAAYLRWDKTELDKLDRLLDEHCPGDGSCRKDRTR